MAVYMVERELPGITPEQLAGAQRAAIATSQQFTHEGKLVRYLRSTFVPDESKCMCLFESSTRQLVREVNEAAKLPFTRIVEALDLTPVVLLLLVLAGAAAGACGANPAAPSSRSEGLALAPSLAASVLSPAGSRSSASCFNVDAHVGATLHADGTATGTISGDINGGVSAAIHQVEASGGGNGALHVVMEHHYTNTSPYGRLDTSDHAVLAPMDKTNGVYRMNNRLSIVGGDGIYANASGYLDTHGTVDFGTGAIDLSLSGRVCGQN
jgi:hypothetical protein